MDNENNVKIYRDPEQNNVTSIIVSKTYDMIKASRATTDFIIDFNKRDIFAVNTRYKHDKIIDRSDPKYIKNPFVYHSNMFNLSMNCSVNALDDIYHQYNSHAYRFLQRDSIYETLVAETFHDNEDKHIADLIYDKFQSQQWSFATKVSYCYMMLKYPAAAELAMEQTKLRIMDFEFAEKRKANERNGYTAKVATDKAKAKFFYDNIVTAIAQLGACDDNILDEIYHAGNDANIYVAKKDKNGNFYTEKTADYKNPEGKQINNLQLMKDRLSFYAFGIREGYPVPDKIAVRKRNLNAMEKPVTMTKNFKKQFEKDPIAVASNIYTLRKWGITNPDYVKQAFDIIHKTSNATEPVRIRNSYGSYYERPIAGVLVESNIMTPLRDKHATSFIKLYGKYKNPFDIFTEFFKPGVPGNSYPGFSAYTEVFRLYKDVMQNTNAQIIRTKDDIILENTNPQAKDSHNAQKKQLKNYLMNAEGNDDRIRMAYQDFAHIYKNNTKEMIDMLAREIKTDNILAKAKMCAKNEGIQSAVEKYSNDLKDVPDIKQAIENFTEDTDTVTIQTRNNKPLFEGSIGEIHDELSLIARKNVIDNESLVLFDDIKAMEDTIVCEDMSILPCSQYTNESFSGKGVFTIKPLKDRFSFVRTAQRLSNCVASGGYFDRMKRGSCAIFVMTDENNKLSACIEIDRVKDSFDSSKYNYTVRQFEGAHDRVVDAHLGPIFTKWCDNHDIKYEDCYEVTQCLESTALNFHGANADFHYDEYDAVTDTVVPKANMQIRNQTRFDAAKDVYGLLDDGKIDLPDVPSDLKNFSI